MASAAILSTSLMVVGMIYGNQAGLTMWILSTPVVFWCGKRDTDKGCRMSGKCILGQGSSDGQDRNTDREGQAENPR